MNKKGVISFIGFVLLVLAGFFVVGVLFAGGISFKISSVLNSIPAWIWVLIGIIFLFKIAGGKKK